MSRQTRRAEDSNDIRQFFLDYCAVSQRLDDGRMKTLESLVEVLKFHFQSTAKQFVQALGEKPLLYSYQSDATSNLCKFVTRKTLSSMLVARRAHSCRNFWWKEAT